MKIAAVILNWCDAEATIRCVDALLAWSVFRGPVYVIDNASPDDSFEVLTKRLPQCAVLRTVVNSGYTGGNNLGLQRAFEDGCDAVLILNNDIDVRLSHDFWSWLEASIASRPMSLIGIPVRRHLQAKDFSFPASHGIITRLLVEAAGVKFQQMPWLLCGCAMVISRQLQEQVGMLNEEFFMYCEEFEYAIRAAKQGERITYSPPELGFVVRSESTDDRAPYFYYYQARNLIAIALLYSSDNKFKVAALAGMVSVRNAVRTRFTNNIRAAILGISHGLRGKRGYLAAVHSFKRK